MGQCSRGGRKPLGPAAADRVDRQGHHRARGQNTSAIRPAACAVISVLDSRCSHSRGVVLGDGRGSLACGTVVAVTGSSRVGFGNPSLSGPPASVGVGVADGAPSGKADSDGLVGGGVPTGDAVTVGVAVKEGLAPGNVGDAGFPATVGEGRIHGSAGAGDRGTGEDMGGIVAICAGVSPAGMGCQLGLHSKSGVCVRLRSSVPSTRTTKMSENPGSSWAKPTKAIMVPSGDQVGCSSPRQTGGEAGGGGGGVHR